MKVPVIQTTKIDQAKAGQMIRELRKKSGVSLRDMALKMNLSAPFVSDMELGRRNWSEEKFASAQKAIAALSK
jgi:transcriptional regulator with XRE-family HTH domain